MRIVSLQIYCIACSISFGQSSSSLVRRKATSAGAYDPYITCNLDGPTHSEGLPRVYSSRVYSELLTLCSSAHGARQNVGCFCSSSTSEVHCDPGLAERGLWMSDWTPENETTIHQFEEDGIDWNELFMPDLCKHGCQCKDPDDASRWFEEDFQGAGRDVGVNGLVQRPQPSRRPVINDDATFGAGSYIGTAQHPANGIGWQNQCGANCTSARDCTAPAAGNSTCTCQAYSSRYIPGSGTVAFAAACLVTLASGGGKRGEMLPCPCNTTYVSHGCCGVLDGLVWEPPEADLGRISAVNEMA